MAARLSSQVDTFAPLLLCATAATAICACCLLPVVGKIASFCWAT